MSNARDVLDFIRFGMSSFAALLALVGYLLFNPPGTVMVFAVISSFCVMGASRAYNSLKDVKEDKINRKKVNPLVFKKEGILIIFLVYLIGFVSSLFLSSISTVIYLVIVGAGIGYSLFRLNARSFSHVIKNFYGAVIASLLFLLGAGYLGEKAIIHYILLAVLIFGISIVADLRDYNGDKKTGKKTLPTTIGYTQSKILSSGILLGFSFLTVLFLATGFLLFAVFSFVAPIPILKNKPRFVHLTSGITSLLTLPWILFVI